MGSQVTSLRMNEAAGEIADTMADEPDVLRIRSYRLGNGARVIDAGVDTLGGIEAGIALAEICMGGLGNVSCTPVQIGGQSHAGLRETARGGARLSESFRAHS